MTALFLYQMIIDKAIQGPSRIDQRGQCPLYRFRSVRCALFCVCVCLASSDHKSIGCINFFFRCFGSTDNNRLQHSPQCLQPVTLAFRDWPTQITNRFFRGSYFSRAFKSHCLFFLSIQIFSFLITTYIWCVDFSESISGEGLPTAKSWRYLRQIFQDRSP